MPTIRLAAARRRRAGVQHRAQLKQVGRGLDGMGDRPRQAMPRMRQAPAAACRRRALPLHRAGGHAAHQMALDGIPRPSGPAGASGAAASTACTPNRVPAAAVLLGALPQHQGRVVLRLFRESRRRVSGRHGPDGLVGLLVKTHRKTRREGQAMGKSLKVGAFGRLVRINGEA